MKDRHAKEERDVLYPKARKRRVRQPTNPADIHTPTTRSVSSVAGRYEGTGCGVVHLAVCATEGSGMSSPGHPLRAERLPAKRTGAQVCLQCGCTHTFRVS